MRFNDATQALVILAFGVLDALFFAALFLDTLFLASGVLDALFLEAIFLDADLLRVLFERLVIYII